MNVLGFNDDEKLSLFKTVAAVLHFGNIVVKQRPREEQAEIPSTSGTHGLSVVILEFTFWYNRGREGCLSAWYQLHRFSTVLVTTSYQSWQ